MKNLLLIFAFVLICSTGFSQTFTFSSSTPGQTQQSYTVSPSHGYTYSYNITATNSTVLIISQYKGTLAMLYNPIAYQQQSSGTGSVPGKSTQYIQSDVIWLMIQNGAYYCYGYAQIYVSTY